MKKFALVSLFATGLCSLTAGATELVFTNHTGAPTRIVELFNVCQGQMIPQDKPVVLQNGESKTFEVFLVMQHYKICGSGFCSSTAIQLKDGTHFELEMVAPGGVIDGKPSPNQWGGPTNPCPTNL